MNRKQKRIIAISTAAAAAVLPVVTLSLLLSVNAKLDTLVEQSTTQNMEEAPRVSPAAGVGREDITAPETETQISSQVLDIDPRDVELIGRTIWGEAMGVESEAERAAVAWCILNRVDAWGQSIAQVVTDPYQFQGYRPNGLCPREHLDLAAEVLLSWKAEKAGAEDVGRVLPDDYLYFIGDGERNHFTTEFLSTEYWDWSLTDPQK